MRVDVTGLEHLEPVADVEAEGGVAGVRPDRRGAVGDGPFDARGEEHGAEPAALAAWCRRPCRGAGGRADRARRGHGRHSHVDTPTSVPRRPGGRGGACRLVVAVEDHGRVGATVAQHGPAQCVGGRRRRAPRRPAGARRGRRGGRPGRRRWRLPAGSWVTRTAVVRAARRIRPTSPARWSWRSRSRPVSGSSRRTRRGAGASERASATRLASPPLRLGDGAPPEPGQADQLEHLRDHAPIDLVRRGLLSLHPQPERDVGVDVAVREQLLVLEHHPDAAPVRRLGGDVTPVEEHLTGVRGEEAGDDAQQRALAAARRPEQGEHLSAGDGQATWSRTGVPSNATETSRTSSVTGRSWRHDRRSPVTSSSTTTTTVVTARIVASA